MSAKSTNWLGSNPPHAAQPVVAVAIVSGAFLLIGENAVGLGRFFEFFLGLRIARILVGVILQRHLPIGFLDVLEAGVALQAEDLVVVAFFCGRQDYRGVSEGLAYSARLVGL